MITEQRVVDVERIHPDFRQVWERTGEDGGTALSRYFLPGKSTKQWLEPTRPKVIKWYCPFACQSVFPSGHRYCINTFVGCEHRCAYCYACGYTLDRIAPKVDFEHLVDKDMADLERFDVPPAPLHLSNSTDCLQACLESRHRHTLYALEQILLHRHRFTTVTILTKNPGLAVADGYIDLFNRLNVLPEQHRKRSEFVSAGLPAFQIEVSLALWREEARKFYEPGAPSVEARMSAIRALATAGIPIVLRIDPLFPHSPLPGGRNLADFGLPEAQTVADLREIVAFARQVGVRHVVYSPVKIVQPRRQTMSLEMTKMKEVYRAMSLPGDPVWRGGSFRLSKEIADREIVHPFLAICEDAGVKAKFCMTNLIETP